MRTPCLTLIFLMLFSSCSGKLENVDDLSPFFNSQSMSAIYWKYRNRLRTHFVRIPVNAAEADLPGYGLPATGLDCGTGAKWSDSTLHLGWYIGMLALEHYLVRNNIYPVERENQLRDLAQTESELFGALKALERLDRNAENSFNTSCGGPFIDKSGFFIRDDIFDVQTATALNKSFHGSDGFSANPFDKEESQDQVHHLLMGLALVKKFCNGVKINGTDVKQLSQTLAKGIVLWMTTNSNWTIINPACGNNPVRRGQYPIFYTLGIKLALDFILDQDSSSLLNYPPVDGEVWLGSYVYTTRDNAHMAMVLAATGNGWGTSTMDLLVSMASRDDWYAYPMLNYLLHGPGGNWTQNQKNLAFQSKIILLSAPYENSITPVNPWCAETSYSAVSAGSGPSSLSLLPGWRTQNRFIRTRTDQMSLDVQDAAHNGLDFMLFYNMFLASGFK